jgi:hypothetical protein
MEKQKTSGEDFRILQQNADLTRMFNKQQYFNPYIYFYSLYNKLSHRHWYKEINKPKLLNRLS